MRKKRHWSKAASPTPGYFRKIRLLSIVAGFIFYLPNSAALALDQFAGNSFMVESTVSLNQPPVGWMAASNQENNLLDIDNRPQMDETQNSLKKNLERWQSLPSDQKNELRERMNQWQNLSPQQQDTYKQRYQKLQELTPGQREKIEQNLDQWEDLSPTEKESVRDLFEE